MKKFEELPKDLQDKIKDHLKAFDSVNVWYENGQYSFVDCLAAQYAPDHQYIGTYKASDIYSEVERIENYINEFHDFPPQYKGKRDYAMLNKMDTERECKLVGEGKIGGAKLACTDWYGKINEHGNFELTERRTVLI